MGVDYSEEGCPLLVIVRNLLERFDVIVNVDCVVGRVHFMVENLGSSILCRCM